ncbi:teneurin-3-like [Clytia hemisphaerica]|uniref:Uncharacterized protein n=1 Tax=Clytia hemisphaerica TaxID=252671 RepID=A0A7M5V8D5_9CNID|eukprot:TCONS_00046240-protein
MASSKYITIIIFVLILKLLSADACSANGSYCEKDSDCCTTTDWCVGTPPNYSGACCSTGASDHGATCNDHTDCCSGSCSGTPKLCECKTNGSDCTSDIECCSYLCNIVSTQPIERRCVEQQDDPIGMVIGGGSTGQATQQPLST